MMPLKLKRLPDQPAAPDQSDLAPETLEQLNHLRLITLRCRSAARADLFRACAALSTDPGPARDTAAELLIRCLAQALGRRPILFRPGVTDVSFDEAWLMRLISCHAASDSDSFTFLLCRRVPRHARRNLAYLIASVSEWFYQN